MKTLKELKKEYGKELKIDSFMDLKYLSCNFIRMVTWKKEEELLYIEKKYPHIIGSIIKDIQEKGFNEALKEVKKNDLHKAYSTAYLYNYYGLSYEESKKTTKNEKRDLI